MANDLSHSTLDVERWTLDVFGLRSHLLVTLCICAASCLAQNPPQPSATPSVVWSIHNPDAIHNYQTNPRIVAGMVNRLVLAATGQADIARAWQSLVRPDDRVGIKICAAGGELFTTHRDVVNAIVDGLVAAGHTRSNIIVWDRSLGGVKEAGYRVGNEGYQLRAIAPRDGYDAKAAFTAPLLGKLVWGDLEYRADGGKIPLLSDTANTSTESHFCHIVSSEVTKIMNVPVMSASETNGIAGALYNVTIPNVDNWRRFAQSSGFAASGIPEIYTTAPLANKVVLNIMDGLVAQYAGGPQAQPNYALHYATLMASRDPVALDAVALRQIEQWRANAKLPPIGRFGTHVHVAAEMGLGHDDGSHVGVIKLGER